jgi:hypothetical protein
VSEKFGANQICYSSSFYLQVKNDINRRLKDSTFGHNATSRNVPSSIPNEVTDILNSPNLSNRTKALGLTQLLTELSTKNLPGRGVNCGWRVRLTT